MDEQSLLEVVLIKSFLRYIIGHCANHKNL